MAGRTVSRAFSACAGIPTKTNVAPWSPLRSVACTGSSFDGNAARRLLHAGSPAQASYRRFGQQPGTYTTQSASPLQQYLELSRGKSGGGGGGGGGAPRRDGRYTLVYGALGLGGVYYVFNLEKVPSTGRWRFRDVSSRQEKEMGKETFQQILRENRGKILPSHDPRVKHVRSVAERIVDAVHRSEHHSDHLQMGSLEDGMPVGSSETASDDVQWEVFVINDPKQVNAFVLPNGKIFVYSGILPICKDTDGLATVLGHEVAHQVLHHSAEKASGYKVLMFGSFILQLVGLDFGLSQGAMTLLLALPNSRKVEVEADKIGLQLMSMACFDPSRAPSLWERMEAAEGSQGGALSKSAQAIMSTHPLSSKRMESLQKWLPEALETRRQSGCPDNATVSAFRSMSSSSLF